jgi:hypothetical protein
MMNKKILIELLQTQLTGKLDSSSNFNPVFLADAIIEKLDLNSTLAERNARKVEDAINKFNDLLDDINSDMDEELSMLSEKETLLKNFIQGQKTACEKLKESLKTI